MRPWHPRTWPWPAIVLAALVLLPLACLVLMSTQSAPQAWAHVREVLLWPAIGSTLVAWLGGMAVAGVLGTGLAWLTAVCEFPGRHWLRWALLLPLALPAYVHAFVWLGLLDFAGPLQTLAREWGWTARWPSPRGMWALCLVFGLALYPYVYLLAYNAFSSMGARSLEAAQSLGSTPWRAFWRVAVPQCWPWVAAGLTLVSMEILADFGTVSVFNVDTLTTVTYKAWFQLFSLESGARISLALAALTLTLTTVGHWAQSRMRLSVAHHAAARVSLRPATSALALAAALLVLLLGLGAPLAQLLVWAAAVQGDAWVSLGTHAWHSLSLGLSAALCVAAWSLLLAWLRRHHAHPATEACVKLSLLGYALPGSVLAVGLFIPWAWLDAQLQTWAQAMGWQMHWSLRSSVLALILGLSVRFMAVGFQAVDQQWQRLTRSQEESAALLGVSRRGLLWRFYPAALSPGLASAMLLVCIDVVKEMPITLMLRPFGWDTLALRIFEWTSEGMWEQAAPAALAILACGLMPIALLARSFDSTAPRAKLSARPAGT
jgi:iron(III) transport system permease protein